MKFKIYLVEVRDLGFGIWDLGFGIKQPFFPIFGMNGCFVDVGIKESGLVHISQLKDGFVSDVNEVVKLHQHVQVKVLEIDESRKRIQLTMIL